MDETSNLDGLPEKIVNVIGAIVVIATFSLLIWTVARNFI